MSNTLFAFAVSSPIEPMIADTQGDYDDDQQLVVWESGSDALAAYYCTGAAWQSQTCRTWTANGYDYCSQSGPTGILTVKCDS